MVASLALTVPVFVIGWGHKYLEVMQQFTASRWVVSEEDSEILERVDLILNQLEDQKQKIKKALPQVKKLAEKQFEYLDTLIKESS